MVGKGKKKERGAYYLIKIVGLDIQYSSIQRKEVTKGLRGKKDSSETQKEGDIKRCWKSSQNKKELENVW